MAYTTYATGLQLVVPDNGQKNWGTIFKNSTIKKINDHGHTGGGDGNKIVAAALDDYSIGKVQLAKTFALFEQSLAPTGTTQTITWTSGSNVILDVSGASGNVTLTFAGAVAGARYNLELAQGATARTITWPAAVLWDGNVEPTQFCDANSFSRFDLYYDGTRYLINYVLNIA